MRARLLEDLNGWGGRRQIAPVCDTKGKATGGEAELELEVGALCVLHPYRVLHPYCVLYTSASPRGTMGMQGRSAQSCQGK